MKGSWHVNYDSALIDVSPSSMAQEARQVEALAKEVSEGLKAIKARLAELRLRWWGQAAEGHEKITNEWDDVSRALFGFPGHPEAGVLNVLCVALGDAAANFAKADLGAADAFRQFANGMESGGGDSSALSFEELGPKKTAIAADYPEPTGEVDPTSVRVPS